MQNSNDEYGQEIIHRIGQRGPRSLLHTPLHRTLGILSYSQAFYVGKLKKTVGKYTISQKVKNKTQGFFCST